jgi:uncharacterized sulfatase
MLLANASNPKLAPYFQGIFAKRPAEELYDLAKDPGQVNNVASDTAYAEQLKQLRERVTQWMQATGDPRAKGDTDFWDRAPYYAEKSRQKDE